jgi:hypothetical protein
MERVSQTFAVFLLLVHVFLGVWGLVGLVEWLVAEPPWTRVSHPLLPRPLLLAQWLLLLGASATFLTGYGRRWRHTPVAMAAIYACMAAVCAVQTIGFLVHDSRWREMAIEYAEYAIILAFLFRARLMRRRFAAA